MKLARLALLAAAGVAIAAFAGVFQPSGAHSAPADTSTGGITVLGTGSTNVIPNRASFAFGTVSQAATANAALAASSQSVARVIAALRKAGVTQADIQTADVSLSPRMSNNGEARTRSRARTCSPLIRTLPIATLSRKPSQTPARRRRHWRLRRARRSARSPRSSKEAGRSRCPSRLAPRTRAWRSSRGPRRSRRL